MILELQCQQIHLKAAGTVNKLTVGQEFHIAPSVIQVTEEITPLTETPSLVDVQDEQVARSDEIESDPIETAFDKTVEQEQPTVSGGYHCNCCKKDFDTPAGQKNNLCPNCYSNKIKEK